MDVIVADLTRWAASGAMALTGYADGPPSRAHAVVASAMAAAADDLATQSARWGRTVQVDGPALLGERAAITHMTRNGDVSVGGAARFVASADGWITLNLPRPEDVASLPALVGMEVEPDDWPRIASALRRMPGREIVERATLLGMAVALPGSYSPPIAPTRELHRGGGRHVSAAPVVLDLSSLWAGPLTASLLGAAGARVIKVEGRSRPDGARRGATAFFDLLNSDKECVRIDFRDRDDRRLLRRLVSGADLVIEASRPRVMDELGIIPELVAEGGTSWLSLTAHGRSGAERDRIGFGDDAAVAGGLFIDAAIPMFVADAVADPIAGLVAAAVGAEMLAARRASVTEVPLARAAAWATRFSIGTGTVPSTDAVPSTVRVDDGDGWVIDIGGERITVEAPRHRPIPDAARPGGSHDAAVRAEFAPSPS